MYEEEESKHGSKDPDATSIDSDMTSHVIARWYRPPEIILNQENYDT